MEVPPNNASKHVGRFLKRHRKLDRDNIMGITKPAIRRLARRGGVVRIQKQVYATIREAIYDRLRTILQQIVHLLNSCDTPKISRCTVTTRDVIYVLNRLGRPIYGFDHL